MNFAIKGNQALKKKKQQKKSTFKSSSVYFQLWGSDLHPTSVSLQHLNT